MKIVLIQCPSWTTESPPYALALLIAALKQNGHEVVPFDFNIELYRLCKGITNQNSVINGESWMMDFRGNVWYEEDKVLDFINAHQFFIEELIDSVINSNAQIIGFSVQSTSKFFSLEIARRIKEKDNTKIIVFGGPLCFKNCYGEDILKFFPFLDLVCFGEAEEALPRLISNIENIGNGGSLNNLKGFSYRLNNGAIIDGGDNQLIEHLDEVNFADYSNFNPEKYTKKLLPISTSRGCINKCSFCHESTHWKIYRRRSAENIFAEITYQLKKNPHIENFWFNDSLINGDIKMLNELCDLLISKKVKIEWGGQGMIRKEMTKDLLQKMKTAGCTIISYGVENGSNKILNLMRKNNYTAELAEEVIQDTFEIGLDVIFNVIVGFPGETESEFKDTIDFVQRCKKYASHIELNTLLLLKGSYLYNNLAEFNIAPTGEDADLQLKWRTNDDLNTYTIRKKRLQTLREAL